MISRRNFLSGLGAGALSAVVPHFARASAGARPLAMPPLLDATESKAFHLAAASGTTNFLGKADSETWGFNQPFLGPTLRIPSKGMVRAEVENGLREDISVHWHGMIIPGSVDGGPHQPIAPGKTWVPELPVDQAPATLWYHSHIHGETGRQVYNGLAGALQVSDGLDDDRGLPSEYGTDDLMLVLQDRRFDNRGRMDYTLAMPDTMMGFLGNQMVINGQAGATAVVPKGIVRLRLLNGSNARIYGLSMSDERLMHLIATDSGLLDRPIELDHLTLAPGERCEMLVDFSDGNTVSLMSAQNANIGMMGGGMMGNRKEAGPPFEVLPFEVDTRIPARITTVPDDLGGSRPALDPTGATPRSFTLDMGMGPGMMMRRRGNRFSINEMPFDMKRTDLTVPRGKMERWTVSAAMMMHPFHVHGVKFQVLSENGRAPRPQNTGWKDIALVNGTADLLMVFDQPASEALPFMFHCHILEHEDGGMMGQFSVS